MNSGSVSFQGPDGGFRLYTMVPEVPTYPAGCVAGENACPICALSIIKCPQVYAGVPGFSTATDPIGFPGRIGSCAYDSVGDCLFTVRKNLTPANATVFDVRHPCIGSILDNMERGAISNWGGKKLKLRNCLFAISLSDIFGLGFACDLVRRPLGPIVKENVAGVS
jgi:hypothetical protein